MAVVSSATLLKTPRRMRSAVILPNQRSTRLSHEDEVGIKLEVKAGMPDKPSLDPWMLVRRIIIGDAVNVQLLRRCPVNRFEEFEELLMTVPRHTLADNLAFQDIERGK